MFRTVPLSIIRSFSLYTQQWYMSYRFADSLLTSCQQTCVTYTIADARSPECQIIFWNTVSWTNRAVCFSTLLRTVYCRFYRNTKRLQIR